MIRAVIREDVLNIRDGSSSSVSAGAERLIISDQPNVNSCGIFTGNLDLTGPSKTCWFEKLGSLVHILTGLNRRPAPIAFDEGGAVDSKGYRTFK